MEPWDGPASIAFTDGTVIGAVLDRNGLRPSRYYVTRDDLVVMASEVGVLDFAPENIAVKERLHPGKVFLVDTAEGRIIDDEELKGRLAAAHPYGEWVKAHLQDIDNLPDAPALPAPDHTTVLRRQQAFGYTHEDLRVLLAPMATQAEEALGSMGTDTSLAVLSNRPRLLYDYFKQLFAQVTNPPLDAIREELVTSMGSTIGPEGNLLDPRPESCRQITVTYPVISNEEVAKLRHLDCEGCKTTTLPMLYDPAEDGPGLERAMDELCRDASRAVAEGCTILILSDRGVDATHAAIPSLLATAGVHHHLVREGTRTRCALVLESGDAREVHHCALLLGYGAGAVNPYLAFETLDDMIRQGQLPGLTHQKAVKQLHQGAQQGHPQGDVQDGHLDARELLRRADLRGDRPEQGVRRQVLHLDAVAHRRRGASRSISEEVRRRHDKAFPRRPVGQPDLDWGGEYQWRRDGEYHLFNPETVFKLQHATRSGQYKIFKEYSHDGRQPGEAPGHAARPVRLPPRRDAHPARRRRAGRVDRQALLDRRDVVRLDQRRRRTRRSPSR